MRKLIWLGCLSYLVIGMAHVVAGAVLIQVLDYYGLQYGDGGQWIMNQFLGFLFGVLAAPYMTRRVGRRNALLAALGALTAAEAAYSLLPPWEWMLTVAPVAGFGFGLTEAVLGAVIIEFVARRKAEAMTRLEVFFGLGALVMPGIAALLIDADVWQFAFPIVTGLAGITTLLWLTVSFGQTDDLLAYSPSSSAGAGVKRMARYSVATMPLLLIGTLYFAIYVGMEMSFSNYLPAIMKERTGMSEAAAASSLSIFWGMMVVGRLFSGRLAEWGGYFRYLLLSTAAGAAVMAFIALTGSGGFGLVWIGLDGLLWSGVFAIGLLYVNERIAGMTEKTTSLLIAAGGLGGALMPRLTGSLMEQYDAGFTLWMLVVASSMLIVLLGAMAASAKRIKRAEAVETRSAEVGRDAENGGLRRPKAARR
ncbi:MAG TPA: MFS transporter [Paenibacillus sp.]|uniref:MFS transporter n=1 Tax=Paenibacillus sp. TaxID=58172 RepID=UPI0028D3B105|nr:MFS transporter [Paenibacillus sp.]HUC94165.1 MFS transporter [Paenibacillus sp.]